MYHNVVQDGADAQLATPSGGKLGAMSSASDCLGSSLGRSASKHRSSPTHNPHAAGRPLILLLCPQCLCPCLPPLPEPSPFRQPPRAACASPLHLSSPHLRCPPEPPQPSIFERPSAAAPSSPRAAGVAAGSGCMHFSHLERSKSWSRSRPMKTHLEILGSSWAQGSSAVVYWICSWTPWKMKRAFPSSTKASTPLDR